MMIKRIIKNDSLFSLFLLVLFTIVFCIMFYALDIYYQFSNIKDIDESVKYKVIFEYSLHINSGFEEKIETPFLRKGNIFLRISTPIGESAFNSDPVDIIWEQNESILEPIDYIEPYHEKYEFKTPSCVIGEKWRSQVTKTDKGEQIEILGVKYNVIGYYKPLMIDGTDDRCLILDSGLSLKDKYQFIKFEDLIHFIYKSNESDLKIDEFYDWLQQFTNDDEISFQSNYDGVWNSYVGLSRIYEGVANKIFTFLSLLCSIILFYLSYVWGKRKQYSFMIKRVMGYSIFLLSKEILSEIIFLEFIAIFISGLFTFIYEVIFNNISEWLLIIKNGIIVIICNIIILSFICLVSNLIWCYKQQPIDILKNKE